MRNNFLEIPKSLIANRRLIGELAKNDFKTRFAGSYMGIVWALMQPVITVLVYWFVFNIMRPAGDFGDGYPFILWMMAGLIPWFYFQEALVGGANVLVAYSYLVKKVVFNISILPAVKVVSSLFIHIFFVGVAIVLYCAYGKFPDLYTVQVIYYTFCMVMLVLGISYMTSAITVFFKDLVQIINILLQVGIWMTPIMWDLQDFAPKLPGFVVTILKLNPMYYIVYGYRDAMVYKVWFWERAGLTLYFWAFVVFCFFLGTKIFRKLQIHFADVL